MATTITKVANKVFNLIKDNEYIDGSPNATAIGDFIDFKTRNGAKLLKSNFADITIIDNVGGGTFTFASSQEVMIKLSELGFFCNLTALRLEWVLIALLVTVLAVRPKMLF